MWKSQPLLPQPRLMRGLLLLWRKWGSIWYLTAMTRSDRSRWGSWRSWRPVETPSVRPLSSSTPAWPGSPPYKVFQLELLTMHLSPRPSNQPATLFFPPLSTPQSLQPAAPRRAWAPFSSLPAPAVLPRSVKLQPPTPNMCRLVLHTLNLPRLPACDREVNI